MPPYLFNVETSDYAIEYIYKKWIAEDLLGEVETELNSRKKECRCERLPNFFSENGENILRLVSFVR